MTKVAGYLLLVAGFKNKQLATFSIRSFSEGGQQQAPSNNK
jgi:hypothetical protein